MNIRSLIISAFLIFTIPNYSFAADQFVKCVQQQVEALGFSPGAIDGIMGRGTRSALAEALKSEALDGFDTEGLGKLSTRSAVSWCRVFSTKKRSLRKYMPSISGLTVLTHPSLDKRIEVKIEFAFTRVKQFFRKEYGLRLASNPIVILTNGSKFARQKIQKYERNFSFRTNPNFLNRSCGKNSKQGGYATRHHITFCMDEERVANILDNDGAFWNLHWLFVHEYTHTVQNEFMQKPSNVWPCKRCVSNTVANWMMEGAASHVAEIFVERRTGYSMTLSRFYEGAHGTKRTLAQIRKSNFKSGDYKIAILAAHLLIDRFGMDAVFEHSRLIGLDNKGPKAFKLAFGIDFYKFERDFERFRRSWKEADAFIGLKKAG